MSSVRPGTMLATSWVMLGTSAMPFRTVCVPSCVPSAHWRVPAAHSVCLQHQLSMSQASAGSNTDHCGVTPSFTECQSHRYHCHLPASVCIAVYSVRYQDLILAALGAVAVMEPQRNAAPSVRSSGQACSSARPHRAKNIHICFLGFGTLYHH